MQTIWEETLGVTVEIEEQNFWDFFDQRASDDYDIARFVNMSDVNDPLPFLDMFASWNGLNDANYNNEDYDDLIKEIYSTQSRKARSDLQAQAEQMVLEDAVIVPINFKSSSWLLKPNVTNVFMDAFGYMDFTRGKLINK